MRRVTLAVAVVGLAGAMVGMAWSGPAWGSVSVEDEGFVQTNLVTDNQTALTSDGGLSNHAAANHTDANLANPWGLAESATGPFLVADNGTGKATSYDGTGTAQSPVITIPLANGGMGGATSPAPPTGVAFNAATSFGGARYVFVTEDGTIATWSAGTTATLRVDNANFTTGPVYKGVAIASNGTVDRLYVTNFRSGTVDVFDSNFSPTTTPGGFADPLIPAGYAPFGITSIGNVLYVTYAEQNVAKHDDVAGPSKGYLAAFNADGHLIGNHNLVSGGVLNAPWGVVLAPPGFGSFGGDLLVGNFGDGTIHAFDQSGSVVGTLTDNASETPVTIDGLWGLAFGNGSVGNRGTLYFTGGIASESDGLFGSLTPPFYAAISSSSLDFGRERIGGSTASKTAKLSSTGAFDLSVFGADIVGRNKADFEIVSDGCSGKTVPSQTTCSATVRFRPSARGPRAATLRFLDDSADSPQTVTLSGTAITPTVKITKGKINRKRHRATFAFFATGATGFQCALVKRKKATRAKPKFSACTAPKTYKHLKRGQYTFEVRAIAAGQVGPAAHKAFKI